MLLNLSGAHAPFFTRNLLVLDRQRPGAPAWARCPAAKKSASTLADARGAGGRPAKVGHHLAAPAATRCKPGFCRPRQPAGAACKPSICVSPFTPLAAIESAMLDLLGQHLDLPVCDLAGRRPASVTAWRCWVTCFLWVSAPSHRSALHQQRPTSWRRTPTIDAWTRLRHEAAMTPDAVVRLAEAAQRALRLSTTSS